MDTKNATTSEIICKALQHTFRLTGLSLIGLGAVIGINKFTNTSIEVCDNLLNRFKEKEESKDKIGEDKKESKQFDFYENLGTSLKTISYIAGVIGSGILLRKVGNFIGSDKVINFFDTETPK